jgi:HD superfamily phosphodiesterase
LDQRVEIWITEAEQLWLEDLEHHVRSLFSDRYLPSHDHTHHRRVWNISKHLLREIGRSNHLMDYALVEGALAAAWFHDVGMVRSAGERHGSIGSTFCRNFFRGDGRATPRSFREVLEAISNHDLKEEGIYSGIVADRRPKLLSILSVADDLEAMGTIGIYRYIEIYLERGIPLRELGERVIQNVNKRFGHLSGCVLCSNLIGPYKEEWMGVVRFFEHYSNQIAETAHPELIVAGPVGVVNHIRTAGMVEQVRPEFLGNGLSERSTDPFVIDYFSRLQHELEKARN